MLHLLRALIIIESVIVLVPFLRVLYSHIQFKRWVFAVRDAAASLAIGQALALQLIHWNTTTWHWYGSPLVLIWIALLGTFLYIRAAKNDWSWNRDVEE